MVFSISSVTLQLNPTLLDFVLHSANPGVYETPPPDFDEAAESQIFDQMINTFRFDN